MRLLIKTDNGNVKIGRNVLILSTILLFLITAVSVFGITGNDYASGTTNLNTTVVQFVSLSPSTGLTQGIMFDTVYVNTAGNPARNNSAETNGGTQYNISVDSSTNGDINFWNKIAAMTCTGGNCYVNSSSSQTNETYDWSANVTVNTNIGRMGNSTSCANVAAGGNCWARYWLDVSTGVTSGNYTTTYTYCGNSTSGTAACP
jgi:hypothetical protein